MHIAYITSEFVTEKYHGGLATYLNNIAAIMARNGHKVTIITLSKSAGILQYSDNIEVVRVPSANIRGEDRTIEYSLDLLCNSWKLCQALKRENKKHKIDIVQAANLLAVGLFRCKSIPTIVRISSEASLWRNAWKYKFDYEQALKECKLSDYLELLSVKHADAAFAPSNFCASVIQKKSGKRISVIESPYFAKEYIMDNSIYQEKLLNKKYLLFNSSLSRLKGTHIGIEATDNLLKKYPDLSMVYVGYDYGLAQNNGNIQKISEVLARQGKKYQGRVLYLKHLSHEQLFPIIKGSLACVLPSRVDNLPNSCIEAMALEKIVIGTYGASFEQLIKNKENGLLIRRDSPAALIKAVDWLMETDEEELHLMGKRAAAIVKRLSPKKVYHEMICFYERVIKEFE